MDTLRRLCGRDGSDFTYVHVDELIVNDVPLKVC